MEYSKHIVKSMDRVVCRHCGNKDAYVEFKDENIKRFNCMDCGYEWEKPTLKARMKKIFSAFF